MRTSTLASGWLAITLCVTATGQMDVAAMWKDPVFQRQFVAAYGVNAEVEPRVGTDEIEILEELRPLMAADLPKAEVLLREHVEPECSAILDFTLGGILFQQGKFDEARVCYQLAVSKFPSFRRAFRNLGLIHARDGDYPAAITAFTRMIELGGGDAYSYGLLGFAHANSQDFQPAEAAYRNALLLQPENTEWRLGLTRCVFRQGKYEDAAALLDALLARHPTKAEFWVLQAHTYLGLKQPLAAAQNLEAVDALGKATVDNLFMLGDVYAGEQLPAMALSAYMRAIDRGGVQSVERPLAAAERFAARGAYDEAQQLAEHLLQHSGAAMTDVERRRLARLQARTAMANGLGSAESIAALEELTRADPLDGESLLLLGMHHARQDDGDRAILCFERAAGITATEARARINHAQILVKRGRFGDALPLLRRAQEIKPREDVARYIEQVERFARGKR